MAFQRVIVVLSAPTNALDVCIRIWQLHLAFVVLCSHICVCTDKIVQH